MHKELASAAAIESAEQCIQNKPKIDVDQVENLNWGPPETIGVDFEQVFFSTDYSDIKGLLPKQFQSDDVVTEIDEAIDRKCFHEVYTCISRAIWYCLGTFINSRNSIISCAVANRLFTSLIGSFVLEEYSSIVKSSVSIIS